MIPRPGLDEDTSENDVRYGIAACRERLRSRRATLRAQHQPPTDVSNGESRVTASRGIESYAEILATLSMSQSSMARLVECLLEPAESDESAINTAEQEEALSREFG
jgi:hypothetical protein